MSTKINPVPDFKAMAEALKRDLPRVVSTEAVYHFRKSFDQQGFTNVTLEPWLPRRLQDGGKTLIRSSFLRDSVDKMEENQKRVVVGTVVICFHPVVLRESSLAYWFQHPPHLSSAKDCCDLLSN